MSILVKKLQELIDKLHVGSAKEEAAPAHEESDLEPSEESEVSGDAPSDSKIEALEALAGDASMDEGEADEESKPALKHNHPILEDCGEDCPLREGSSEDAEEESEA